MVLLDSLGKNSLLVEVPVISPGTALSLCGSEWLSHTDIVFARHLSLSASCHHSVGVVKETEISVQHHFFDVFVPSTVDSLPLVFVNYTAKVKLRSPAFSDN